MSIFTKESRSVMIVFSRSISSAMSVINSLYSSFGTSPISPCATRESASTFMEVNGVFNSWDTLETNSCRESSCTFIRLRIRLYASDRSSVSV